MRRISRLKKIALDSTYVAPNGILLGDTWKWIENDPITKTHYHTNIDQKWYFEEQIDDMEWELQK